MALTIDSEEMVSDELFWIWIEIRKFSLPTINTNDGQFYSTINRSAGLFYACAQIVPAPLIICNQLNELVGECAYFDLKEIKTSMNGRWSNANKRTNLNSNDSQNSKFKIQI